MADDDPHPALDRTRIVLRPLASPLPLGLFALALGSLVLGVAQLGGIEPGGGDLTVTAMLAAYVALPQLVASVIAFLTRESTVATLLALTGMSWPANLVVALTAPGADTVDARGVLFVGIGATLLLLGAATVTNKPLVGLLVLVVASRYVANGAFDLTGVPVVESVSGVFALTTTALAGYLGIALALEDSRGRTVLPTGRRGPAQRAFTGDLGAQLRSLPHEAGVRNQL